MVLTRWKNFPKQVRETSELYSSMTVPCFSSTTATAVKGFRVTHKVMGQPQGARDKIYFVSAPAGLTGYALTQIHPKTSESVDIMSEGEEYDNCLFCPT